LYPLEINYCLDKGDQDQAETVTQEAAEPNDEIPNKDHDQDEPTVYNDCSVSKESSSKRLSALRAQERLKNWTEELLDNAYYDNTNIVIILDNTIIQCYYNIR